MTPSSASAGLLERPATVSAGVLQYVIADCSLGVVLIATSAKGICAVTLGDNKQLLLNDLAARFPDAALEEGISTQTTATVIALIENPRMRISLPLDILTGTAFQRSVWQALCAIPLGQTATYADIAQAIGQPTAVRAVAQACGANHIAVIIPCHRVVRSDGNISGYRWGVARKKELLQREGVNMNSSNV